MIRDQEIARLIKYAQGLNTTVRLKEAKKASDAAEWTTDGSGITIFTSPKQPKIDVVLSLIHELGHHLVHIHNNDRKVDEKLEEAIDSEEDKKVYRKKLYDWEVEGAAWWESIYKDTDCKFDIEKLNQAREFDLWQYEVYYRTGKFPKYRERQEKRKELKKRRK